MKLDQNKPRENQKAKDSSSTNNNNILPKEHKKLTLDMTVMDSKPRTRGDVYPLLNNEGETSVMESEEFKLC